MKDLYSHILRQVLLEISDSAKKRIKDKWRKDDSALTDEAMNYYIEMFEKYSSSANFPKKDIFQYTFKELEQIVDKNYPRKTNKATEDDKVDFKGSEDVIYNDKGLLILKGDLKEKCIRYGKGYSWCISRNDTSNMFTSYRYRMNEPAFYFVFDEDKPENDVWHAIVIYVDADGIYHVATSDNPGDKEMSWGDIEGRQPKLKGLQNLFKHVPLTKEERDFYVKYKGGIREISEWNAMSFDEKEKFISVFPDKVTTEMLKNSPKQLVSKYAVTTDGKALDKDLYEKLPNSDKKKLDDNIIQLREQPIAFKLERGIQLTPEELNVEGDLWITDYSTYRKVEKLPENMTISGNLNITEKRGFMTELPKGLKVMGSLTIRNTFIDTLPDNLYVGQDFGITSANDLKFLPRGLKVGGDLVVKDSGIEAVLENVTVNGMASFSEGKNLKTLSKGLKVGDFLNLENTGIEALPEGLEVGGMLDIDSTNITKLPRDLKVRSIKLNEHLKGIYGRSFITQEKMLSKPEALSESVKLKRLKSN